ncbi:MAG: DUF971 domain-containing protein [Verrucomicrobia bacterium]|nr:DUF971 domain-containing protein [Verrucomicrobiota bacterium]
MVKPLNPLSLITVAPFGSELALAWDDGVEQFLTLENLRRACPCAVCCGEPDVMGRGDAQARNYKQGSFELKSYDFVGGYGLKLSWADGHSTGIYSYTLLRSL